MISRSRACFVGLAMIAVLGFVPTTQAKTLRPDASEAFSKLLLSRRQAQQVALYNRLEAQIVALQGKDALLKARLAGLKSIVQVSQRQDRQLRAQEKQLTVRIAVTERQMANLERRLPRLPATPVR